RSWSTNPPSPRSIWKCSRLTLMSSDSSTRYRSLFGLFFGLRLSAKSAFFSGVSYLRDSRPTRNGSTLSSISAPPKAATPSGVRADKYGVATIVPLLLQEGADFVGDLGD